MARKQKMTEYKYATEASLASLHKPLKIYKP